MYGKNNELADALASAMRDTLEKAGESLGVAVAFRGVTTETSCNDESDLTIAQLGFRGEGVQGAVSLVADAVAFGAFSAALGRVRDVPVDEEDSLFAFGDFAEEFCASVLRTASVAGGKTSPPQILQGRHFKLTPPQKRGTASASLRFELERGAVYLSFSLN